jgi:hypothetical protein
MWFRNCFKGEARVEAERTMRLGQELSYQRELDSRWSMGKEQALRYPIQDSGELQSQLRRYCLRELREIDGINLEPCDSEPPSDLLHFNFSLYHCDHDP